MSIHPPLLFPCRRVLLITIIAVSSTSFPNLTNNQARCDAILHIRLQTIPSHPINPDRINLLFPLF